MGRASSLVFSSLKFASLLFTESLHPDLFRGMPLCMAQFRHIFGSARIPIQDGRDIVTSDPDSKHMAVLCRGQLYYFQALHDDGAVALREPDIANILEAILHDSSRIKESERATKR